MQDVSSFTLGPVVGEGLCVVNAAFSKSICIFHIEGGGKVDLKRKRFWARSKKPLRRINLYVSAEETTRAGQLILEIDDELHDAFEWLENNKDVWFEEFDKWRKCVALCSTGDFHWCNIGTGDRGTTIGYYVDEEIVDFVTWKKKAYIAPAYELIPKTPVYTFLMEVWDRKKIPLGLVHPKARGDAEEPITTKYIRDMYDSDEEMCCMPYVVAGFLLGVKI